MSSLSINGIQTGGKVYELHLKAGQSIADVKKMGENDGYDQVYFQSGDRFYMAEGVGLNLEGWEQRVLPKVSLELADGSSLTAQVMAVDDEIDSAWQGITAVFSKTLGLDSDNKIVKGAVAGQRGTFQINNTTIIPRALPQKKDMGSEDAHVPDSQNILFNEKARQLPSHATVKEMLSVLGAQTAEKAASQTQKSVSFGEDNLGLNISNLGWRIVKTGLYTGGTIIAVAGSALYGITRSQYAEALGSVRGPEVR